MKVQWLTDWERAAIAKAVEKFLADGQLEVVSGATLVDKLDKATHVRLSFPNAAPYGT